MTEKKKILIIRFSSFGDIVQALRVPLAIKEKWPEAEIHWLVKENFSSLVASNPQIDKVIRFKGNIAELWQCLWELKNNKYDAVYDAHNNLRSNFLFYALRFFTPFQNTSFCQRPKHRLKRLLLFRFHMNFFRKDDFIGQMTFLKPLKKWGIESKANENSFFLEKSAKRFAKEKVISKNKNIAAVASAMWPLKRWPQRYWEELLEKLKDKNYQWYFLGGPEDEFIDEICSQHQNAHNLRGKCSLQESSAILNECDLVISNDTGLLHVADQLNKKGLAFIGPSAFGYPFSSQIEVMEVDLYCKPCSKDGSAKCINKVKQKCLKDVKPELVVKRICEILG